jgi:hypothetical protein
MKNNEKHVKQWKTCKTMKNNEKQWKTCKTMKNNGTKI